MSALVPPFRVTLELLGANNRQGRAACNRRHTLLMKARRTTLARYNTDKLIASSSFKDFGLSR